MTKKDYIKIACIIKGEREVWEDNEPRVKVCIDNIQDMLSELFIQDNPKFDKDKFLKGCNL